ncbi:YbaB/EbfC family nucleoid-associated protein [Microbispora hainanensis]|uniref:YbaB/EbfC family nucleoid-associated protein n=1 Tax=Microbispora TaxID=2005 RepID=UPI001158905B|nr:MULTISPECIES: YbaB/EbfC family nucleoid-associated protein [Microbispora]NJP24187.1 YbaB/EbfC family nucleoid-associated protein [Microbispora sp. CL1-1]TQS14992.1 YbaB/EbfC family nucleoid-associated protein [Microbispora sp. SCL1-1]
MADGGFDDFDVERFQQRVDARITAVERLQTTLSSLVGRARDEDGLVSVEVSARGLSELELHPKAMRLSSGELAERIKETMRAASDDLYRQMNRAMADALGPEGDQSKFLDDPEAVLAQVREAESAFDRTAKDVLGELDRISRSLGL